MSELLEAQKAKICVEIEFEDDTILQNLTFSANSKVLGGKVTRVDFEGDVFNECDFYRDLFDNDQMVFLLSRKKIEEAKNIIFKAFEKMISEIKFEESLENEEEIM